MGLRVGFFGTPDAAVPTLERIAASRHAVAAVVTAPDRPRGRGMAVTTTPVGAAARALGLPLLQPPTVRDPTVLSTLGALGADIFVVCAYGLILPQALLDIPRLGCINVHFSLLPRYRGAAPVARAILDGQAETGVTIMEVVAALDAGPMLARVREPIRPYDDTGSLEGRLAGLGAGALVDVLDRLEAGPVVAEAQDDAAATYAAKVTAEGARIDWSQPAVTIGRQVRAFSPRPGAWTTLEGKRLKLWRSTVAPGASGAGEGDIGSFEAGSGGAMVVAGGDGAVVAEEVQPEGGRRMSGAEFLRGRRGAPGHLV